MFFKLFNRTTSKKMGKDFVAVPFKGIDDDSFCHGVYKIDSQYFDGIEFISKNKAKFYLKDDLEILGTEDELLNETYDILLKLFIQLLKESSYTISNFEIEKGKVTIKIGQNLKASLCDNIGISDAVSVIRQDGLSEGDRAEITHRRIEKTITDSFANERYLLYGNSERLLKLFQIEDPVIRYFLMYSWLCDLCDPSGKQAQKDAKEFIQKSDIFKNIPTEQQYWDRKDESGDIRTEDIFTYLRNIIGHSVNDILKISDKSIIGKIETFSRRLFCILLEKLGEIQEP